MFFLTTIKKKKKRTQDYVKRAQKPAWKLVRALRRIKMNHDRL